MPAPVKQTSGVSLQPSAQLSSRQAAPVKGRARHGWSAAVACLLACEALGQAPKANAGKHAADGGTRPGKGPTSKEVVVVPSTDEAPPMRPRPGCVDAPQGLVSWWPAEGDMRDVAGPNLMRMAGKAAYTQGRVGLAFLFDGTHEDLMNGSAVGFPVEAEDRTMEL
jgi:hypothetical protein